MRTEWRWALIAGILTGFALGTKATALVQFGLLALALAWAATRSGERKAWAPVAASRNPTWPCSGFWSAWAALA